MEIWGDDEMNKVERLRGCVTISSLIEHGPAGFFLVDHSAGLLV